MKAHIHIVGCAPRSGTTLLAEMCKTCFEIDGYCEHEQSALKPIDKNNQITLTKHPREALYMPALLRANNKLWCIFVMRDPRDVIASQHKNSPGQYYVSLRFWNESFRTWLRLRAHPRFITVRYEDLVRNPDIIQGELIRRMPWLRAKFRFSEYHQMGKFSEFSARAMHSVRAPDTASIRRWETHLPRIKGQLEQHGDIDDALQLLGYESNADWKKMLSNVAADMQPSAMEESVSRRKKIRLKWRLWRKTTAYLIRQWF